MRDGIERKDEVTMFHGAGLKAVLAAIEEARKP